MVEALANPARTNEDDEPLSPELEAQIDRALELAKDAEPAPAISAVRYLPDVHALSVQINTGQRLLIPAEDIQNVANATPEQLEDIEIIGFGEGVDFPSIDTHFSMQGLLAGTYGNKRWMEALATKRALALQAAA